MDKREDCPITQRRKDFKDRYGDDNNVAEQRQ